MSARGPGLQEIYERYGGWIRAQARRFCRRDCEDAVQETLLRLATALPRQREGHEEAVRALVARTVRSVCIDALRRGARRPAGEGPAEDPPDPGAENPVEAAERRESEGRLAAASAGLPDRERQILRLRFHDGLSFREIAELLDVPQGSVAGWYSRALARLREALT